MKRSENNVQFITDATKQFIGISLGCISRSEHEHGISTLQCTFGLEANAEAKRDGAIVRRARTVRTFPHGVHTFEEEGNTYLVFHPNFLRYPPNAAQLDVLMRAKPGEKLVCAWLDGLFAIRTNGFHEGVFLNKLWMAMEDGDCLMFQSDAIMGGLVEYASRPLIFAISSLINDDDLELLVASFRAFEEKG